MTWRLAAALAMLLCAGTPLMAADDPSAPARTVAGDGPATATLAPALWHDYKDRFIKPDGRLADDGNGGISHSEGQGYAMLLAVAADDGLTFARLWGWTAKELYTGPDGLASWRWNPDTTPHVKDPNNATDGDLLIAWALARAAQRWNSPEYKIAARRIALAIGQHATFQGHFGLMLRPGVFGFDAKDRADGPVVNLSYWVFPAFPALREVAPEVDWGAMTASGLALLEASRFGPLELPSDWISVDHDPAPAKTFPPTFAYDAVRIPLYLAWAGLGQGSALRRFGALVQNDAPAPILDLQSGLTVGTFADGGYAAVFALARCAEAGGSGEARIKPGAAELYYPTSLHLLALLAAAERGLACARS